MNKNDSLGNRMKFNYEDRTRYLLPRRTYAVIRIDGRSFHTFTKGLERPYDQSFNDAMDQTAKYLCENIAGAKLAYVQSDEISIVLTDFDKIDTQAFFDGNIQKIVSVTASMASAYFNQHGVKPKFKLAESKSLNLAAFDARVFTISDVMEVYNSLLWRQKDAERNSLQMLAQSNYSQKQLNGKKRQDLHDMLHEKGVNWNDQPTRFKRGACVVRSDLGWYIDYDIPVFTQDQNYILDRLPRL